MMWKEASIRTTLSLQIFVNQSLEKITHPALFSTTLSLKLKTNDSVAMTTFCAIVYNYVTRYWGEGSLKVILLRMRMKSRPFPACAISGK